MFSRSLDWKSHYNTPNRFLQCVHSACTSGNLKTWDMEAGEQGPLDVPFIASLLRRCADRKDLTEGKRIHHLITENGHQIGGYVANLLIQMYGKCGALEDAKKIFESMDCRNVFSWNIMVNVYIQHGRLQKAIDLFQKTPLKDIVSRNAGIVAYAQSGQLYNAIEVFQEMPERDLVSWNSLLAGFVRSRQLGQAFHLFQQMPERDAVSWNAMVSIFARGGKLKEATKIFQQMPERTMVSWTTMISGYTMQGKLEDAFQLFLGMPKRDLVAWTTMILGYGKHGHLKKAFQLFQLMPKRDVIAWNAIINVFVAQGQIDGAMDLFERSPQRDASSWNTMIKAYGETGQLHVAFQLFHEMQFSDIKPDKLTFITLLDACATCADLCQGTLVHKYIRASALDEDILTQTALINMYAKCGSVEDAFVVFEKLTQRNLISWNAMIAAYSHHGHAKEAIQTFWQMQLAGVVPDKVTLVSIISCCSHSGLVHEGYHWFMSVSEKHNFTLTSDHYICMVDLLGRAGHLEAAESLIISCPTTEPNVLLLTTLFGSCQAQ